MSMWFAENLGVLNEKRCKEDVGYVNYCAAAAPLIIIKRIIINRHSAIFFRLYFVIFWRVYFDFLRLIDEKSKVVPKFVLVADTFRHNMT